MLLNKEILTGLYGGGKTNINFNISWNTTNTTITAYDPRVNENDRPRINTWRSDDSYITYLSAGNQVFDFNTKTFSTPWGDRSVGSQSITIPVKTTTTAGVDLFTDDSLPRPYLVPDLPQWVVSNTGNPNEKRYQYSINRFSSKTQNISVILFDKGVWDFNYTSNSNLNIFSVTTNPPGNVTIFWGDNKIDTIGSGGAASKLYEI